MKHLTGLTILLASVAPFGARADVVPMNARVTTDGLSTWSYRLGSMGAPEVNSPAASGSGPMGAATRSLASSFTLYDFAGYVLGSCTAPAGWICTQEAVGSGGDAELVNDRPDILNLTWHHTSAPDRHGASAAQDLGLFTAQSLYCSGGELSYLARVMPRADARHRSVWRNAGEIQGPTDRAVVAAPATLVLAGLGVALLGLTRPRRAASARSN